MRKEFADSIAELIGKYITQISKYDYSSLHAESLNEKKQKAYEQLQNKRDEYNAFSRKIEGGKLDNEDLKDPEGKRERIKESYHDAKDEYYSAKKEYDENSKFGNRLEANEAFFTIKSKLSGIESAKQMIELMEEIHHESGAPHKEGSYGKWISDKCDELILQYQHFRDEYVNSKGTN